MLMKRTVILVALFGGLFAAALPKALTAPTPSDIPIKWELKFEHQTPRPIRVTLPGEKRPKTFWYMLYTVTNQTRDDNTGRGTDRDFIPEFTIYTDTGQTIQANRRVSSVVFEAIKKQHNNPLLKNHIAITGKILFGRDNARDGAAIWPDFDAKAGSFDIFVGGLSGETAVLKLPHPITVTETGAFGKEQTVTKDKMTLTKMLQLNYSVPGEAGSRIHTKATFSFKRWVMR
jgi:hypothetical protein